MRDEVQLASEAARRAGQITLKYYGGKYGVRDKGQGNPVTTADLEADTYLRQILLDAQARRYNQKDPLIAGGLVAGNESLANRALQLIAEVT